MQTVNALTGAVLFSFAYDAAGLLTQVVQKTGGTDRSLSWTAPAQW